MLLLKILIFLCTTNKIYAAKNNNTFVHFLKDFFEEKNVTVTLNLCWDNDEILNLVKFFHFQNFKGVVINRNFSSTDFFKHMQFDNYVVLDITCYNAEYILHQANTSKLFAAPYKWLLIKTHQDYFGNTDIYFDTYKSILNNYLIQLDSEVLCAENVNDEIDIWFYFKINENQTIGREKYGKWSNTSGLTIQLSYNITSFRRRNVDGSNIRIVSVLNDNNTMIHLDDYKFPMIDTITKTQYGILMALMQYMNATPIIIPVDQWGVIEDFDTERWGGMCGFIQRKEADISGTAMFFFKNRLKIGKYLKLTNPSVIQFIFRKPPLSIEQNIYSLPFSWAVWISSICLTVLITVLLILSSFYENPRNEESVKVGFGNIILLMAAAVCQQGTDIVPTGVPGRTLTLFVFTAFMFLYVSYSANIVALLQSSSDSIKTMEDLLNSQNMKVGCHNISYNFQYFQNATEKVRKAIYKEKIGPKGYYELEEGIEKVRQGLFAFHVEEGSAYYYMLKTFEEHEKCDTTAVPGVFDAQLGWMQSRIDSPHTEIFKIGLYKIGEYGIERRYFLRFYRRSQCYFSAASFTSVGMTDFYPALLIFIYGLMCSIFIFFVEHAHKRYSRKRNDLKSFLGNKRKAFRINMNIK